MIRFVLLLAIQDTSRLTLPAAVERALAQYPTVAAARALAERAAADVGETRSALLPRLTLDANLTQWQEPSLVYPLHSIPTAPGTGELPTFDRTVLQGSAFATWTLFDFGARSRRVAAARRAEGAAQAALGVAEQQLAARTGATYLRVLTLRQVLAAQDQRIAALLAESERARRLFGEGKAPRLQVLRAAAELARANADRSATAGALDVAVHELAQLVGDSVGPLAEVALRDTAAPDRAGLVARALEASPELAEATRRAEAARALAGAARAASLPELRLTAGLVPRGAANSEVRTEWQAGLGMSWPLYTGGQRSAQVRRAEAEARAADEQRRLAALAVVRSVDRAIAAVVEARSRVTALEAAVAASEAVASTERTALEVGAGTQTDYLDALTALLRERAGLIDSRHAEIAARIELARVTGRLSPDFLNQLVEIR